MKAFLAEKGKGFYATMTTAVCLLAGILCFVVLLQGPVEADENPALVICLAVAALVLCLVSAYKDFFKLPTLAAFICTTIAAIFYLRGRVSYLAYYFTGDVLGTGLSPAFVLGAVCFLTALAASICGMLLEQEKLR